MQHIATAFYCQSVVLSGSRVVIRVGLCRSTLLFGRILLLGRLHGMQAKVGRELFVGIALYRVVLLQRCKEREPVLVALLTRCKHLSSETLSTACYRAITFQRIV